MEPNLDEIFASKRFLKGIRESDSSWRALLQAALTEVKQMQFSTYAEGVLLDPGAKAKRIEEIKRAAAELDELLQMEDGLSVRETYEDCIERLFTLISMRLDCQNYGELQNMVAVTSTETERSVVENGQGVGPDPDTLARSHFLFAGGNWRDWRQRVHDIEDLSFSAHPRQYSDIDAAHGNAHQMHSLREGIVAISKMLHFAMHPASKASVADADHASAEVRVYVAFAIRYLQLVIDGKGDFESNREMVTIRFVMETVIITNRMFYNDMESASAPDSGASSGLKTLVSEMERMSSQAGKSAEGTTMPNAQTSERNSMAELAKLDGGWKFKKRAVGHGAAPVPVTVALEATQGEASNDGNRFSAIQGGSAE
jgi:hypothetical protein